MSDLIEQLVKRIVSQWDKSICVVFANTNEFNQTYSQLVKEIDQVSPKYLVPTLTRRSRHEILTDHGVSIRFFLCDSNMVGMTFDVIYVSRLIRHSNTFPFANMIDIF